ncbi:MAG TPA: lytic transglycosylase domain-containing protein [Limnobacter sp.]|nr:lytic transglycosylase domain-containing protein [Limnobacter sp.]
MPTAFAAEEQGFPVAFSHEAPQVRAALERGYITANAGDSLGGPKLAYLEFCEAARMGSAEGHFRAGVSALSIDGPEARWALFHLHAADELGHAEAHRFMVLRAGSWSGQLTGELPACLQAPPDLVALRASLKSASAPVFDFDRYATRLPTDRRTVLELVRTLAAHSFLGVDFVMAVAAVESNFNARARSPKDAMGVMQLIPGTAARFGVADPYDPKQNIAGGIRYLEWLHRRFKGDLILVAAAYNAGEGAVDRYKGIPPFKETQLYVQKVLRYSSKGRHDQK